MDDICRCGAIRTMRISILETTCSRFGPGLSRRIESRGGKRCSCPVGPSGGANFQRGMVTGLRSVLERKRGRHPDAVHAPLAADADMPLSCTHLTPNSALMFVGRMNQVTLRTFSRLRYRDPRAVLVDLRKLELRIGSAEIDPRVRHLRTNDLRNVRELRSACLFCHGMSELTGQKYAVAHSEAVDYDAVATWIKDGTQTFAPIQLKEVPPAALNPRASVQEVIDGLAKYPGSEDVTVVVHLNQRTRFLPSELTIPPLRLAALWVFAGITPDQSRWAMWGNLLEPVESWQAGTFDYPEPT